MLKLIPNICTKDNMCFYINIYLCLYYNFGTVSLRDPHERPNKRT